MEAYATRVDGCTDALTRLSSCMMGPYLIQRYVGPNRFLLNLIPSTFISITQRRASPSPGEQDARLKASSNTTVEFLCVVYVIQTGLHLHIRLGW